MLDTLREPFTAEPRMVHGNFAQLYPFDVRAAEGWQQVSLLRRLADLLDLETKVCSENGARHDILGCFVLLRTEVYRFWRVDTLTQVFINLPLQPTQF